MATNNSIDNSSDYIDIDTTSNPSYKQGRVFYSTTEKAISYYNDESDISVNVGQENLIRVRNESGGTINKGEAVYTAGSAGAEERPSVIKALATTEATSRVLGVATHDIGNNEYGYVTQFGVINDINTASFSAGDPLYLSESVAGGFQTTPPSSPNFAVFMGDVLKSDAATGKIFITALGNTGGGGGGAGSGSATQLVASARKGSAGTINAGSAVYITGYNVGADVILVELAQSNSSSTMPSYGIALSSFTNSTTGQLILNGRLAGQNTSSFSVGDAIYVSSSVAGGLTNVKPVANNLIQKIGIVARSNISNGVIDIVGAGRSNDIPNFTAADKAWYGGTGGVSTEMTVTSQARALLDDTTQLAQAQTILNNVGVTAATVAGGDKILGLDIDDSGNLKSFTASSLSALGGATFVLLGTATASASATIDFANLLTATYDDYFVSCNNVLPASSAVTTQMRVGTGVGPTYETTNYSGNGECYAGSQIYSSGTGALDLTLASRTANTASRVGGGQIFVKNANASTDKTIYSDYICWDSTGSYDNPNHLAGRWQSATVITSLRFLMSSGNISTGTYYLYGIKKS